MKKIFIACLTGIFFLAACENTGSSTVGTYEKEERSQSSEKSEGEGHGEKAKEHSESTTSESANHDTSIRNSGDAQHGASGVEVKTGANVPVDSTKSRAPQH